MKKVIYISNSDSQSIEVWNLYNNGSIDLIQKVEIYSQVQPINIIKNKKLLYAGISKDNQIITFNIDKNGYLNKQHAISFPGKANYLSFDQNKKLLFCSSYHSNTLIVSRLDKNGIPHNPIQIICNIQGCHAAKVNYKYNVLFVTSLKEDCIYLYYLTDFGILKNTEQKILYTQKQSGPRHITFHPNQDFFYTINELNGTVDVWKIDNTKNTIQVKNIQNINITSNKLLKNYWSSDIHLTSCGRFLYVSDRYLNIISLFHIDSDNKKIIFIKSYPTELQPRSFCIDPDNQYLIVAGEKSNRLAIYDICKNTGELNQLNTYDTGHRPIWILVHSLD
ncbi:6-phosphogluconolactonase [Buchnera aphidicola (Macrosiphoniella sanborni)]|uniref:6-phosphogluconolactonase n=1 Tax=Buchnera aphidicola (Macrosiphoniella sanborni) TaxID=1241865 RepID=A0A4D6YBH5_9GAMM|nr:6-phosphogluconolactonase [Buchnera aphidicola]QCI23831.1 6-phosphogluconolactonase [Buchnera aphidicola (Macrosiphoniella sanborni)]